MNEVGDGRIMFFGGTHLHFILSVQYLNLIQLLLQVELAYFDHGDILPYVIRNLSKQ